MTFDVPHPPENAHSVAAAGVSKRGSSICSFVCWSIVCHYVQLASCLVADLSYRMNKQSTQICSIQTVVNKFDYWSERVMVVLYLQCNHWNRKANRTKWATVLLSLNPERNYCTRSCSAAVRVFPANCQSRGVSDCPIITWNSSV